MAILDLLTFNRLLAQKQSLRHVQADLKEKIDSANSEDKDLFIAQLATADQELQDVRAQLRGN